jgi:hypothetical protein
MDRSLGSPSRGTTAIERLHQLFVFRVFDVPNRVGSRIPKKRAKFFPVDVDRWPIDEGSG